MAFYTSVLITIFLPTFAMAISVFSSFKTTVSCGDAILSDHVPTAT